MKDEQRIIKNIPVHAYIHGDPTRRVTKARLMGQSVSGGKVGDIITGNPATSTLGAGVSSGLTSVPNGTSLYVNFALSDNFGRVLLAIPDIAVYTGTVISANLWPNASYGIGNVPITIFNNWGLTNNVNVVTTVAVRNNSGGDISVTVINRFRIITNASVALSGTVSGTSSQ